MVMKNSSATTRAAKKMKVMASMTLRTWKNKLVALCKPPRSTYLIAFYNSCERIFIHHHSFAF
jgi:hypothetical protein